jgi:Spy/CpxP family protein refolding chaperone
MKRLIIGALLIAATAAYAQHAPQHGGHGAAPAAPYSGMQARPIKALSAEQVADLEAGRGMGLALAAELNSYPGPTHVLELADRLALTHLQRQQSEANMAPMQARARELGRQLLAAEAALDRAFANATITEDALRQQMMQIGHLQAELRAVHLEAHIRQRAILTTEQVAAYNRLRGYAAR